MMMNRAFGLATIGVLASASLAWAQAEPAASPAAASAAGAAAADAEIQSFARATLQLHALAQPTPEQMAQAIAGAGIPVERYNEIAAQMQKDPALQSRVNAALISAQKQAAATATPGGAAASAAQPAAPPPPIPTSGVGGSIVGVLQKVCLPMLREDQPVTKAAPAAGLRLNKKSGTYTAALGAAPYSVSVRPRGANQQVCNVEIHHPLESGDDIAKALNIWSMHQPEMKMVRNDAAVGADGLKRVTLSWEQEVDGRDAGLVFVRVQRPDGTPVEPGFGTATLLYSEQTG